MNQNKTKLTGIFLKKFQSISEPIFINLEKLTFLYGPNSAGKSSIIDAIKLIENIAVKNKTEYNTNFLFRKHKHKFQDSTAIGLEVRAGILRNFDNPEVEKWADTKDSSGDYSHYQLNKKLLNRKIQIEFSDESETLKIAIDGQPFFELIDTTVEYSSTHKKTEYDSPDMKSDDSMIWGQLKIHKNSPFYELIEDSIEDIYSKDSNKRKEKRYYTNHYREYHHELLISEDEDTITINGINFEPNRFKNSRLVSLTGSVDELLFYEHDNDAEDLKIHGEEANKFLYEHFCKTSPFYNDKLNARRSFYWKLNDIAHDFNLITQSIFFHIQSSLEISHVKGDRGLLNSDHPFYVPTYEKISKSLSPGTEYDHLQRYAQYLSDPIQNAYLANKIKSDFVNTSLSKNLTSLRGYEVSPETHKLLSPSKHGEDKNHEIIYLNIKNSNKDILGFQDVGSGLSYIMPILTSLWASKFSVIEQPELHLHPKSQCELGDVFISAYNKGSISLIESHSEHLLLRTLRRIRETTHGYLIPNDLKLTNEDLSIYYFDPKPEGHTIVKKIRIDRYGELLDNWPGGFFSERDSELFS